jgi:U3 small nucleolar ribonucleoprotein protein IMP4
MQQRNTMDDEYLRAGEVDPRVMITTSRNPSSRLVQFAKEMTLIFPNSTRINRGSYTTNDVVEACRKNDVTDLVMVHEHRGEPGATA